MASIRTDTRTRIDSFDLHQRVINRYVSHPRFRSSDATRLFLFVKLFIRISVRSPMGRNVARKVR